MYKRMLGALIAISALLTVSSTPVMAGFGIGIAGAGANLSTDGKETLKDTSVVSKRKETEREFVPSGFIQYSTNWGLTVGVEHVPGTATLGAESVTKNDLQSGNSSTSITQKAEAELSDHTSYYVETPGFFGPDGMGQTGVYLKYAFNEVDITTKESLGSGATYGDITVDGHTWALGYKLKAENGFLIKVEGSFTDYDDITLTSSADSAGDTSTINAASEVIQAKISVGYSF